MMAKSTVTPETSADDLAAMLVEQATVTDNVTAKRNYDIVVPDAITTQVKELAESEKVAFLPVTDDATFDRIKGWYLAAANKLGRSANVLRHYAMTRDADGNEVSRTWESTRVTVGQRRGRSPEATNGSQPAPETTTSETPAAPQFDRGW